MRPRRGSGRTRSGRCGRGGGSAFGFSTGYKSPMPELPEVETVARDLRPLLVGRTLVGLTRSRKALRQNWSKAWEARLLGQRVEAVHRRGQGGPPADGGGPGSHGPPGGARGGPLPPP